MPSLAWSSVAVMEASLIHINLLNSSSIVSSPVTLKDFLRPCALQQCTCMAACHRQTQNIANNLFCKKETYVVSNESLLFENISTGLLSIFSQFKKHMLIEMLSISQIGYLLWMLTTCGVLWLLHINKSLNKSPATVSKCYSTTNWHSRVINI